MPKPRAPPKPAISSVPTKSCQCMAGNHAWSRMAAPGAPTHSRATIEPTAATSTTRRYCMNATSRASAPKAPDISIMTEAPPGAVPHTAVVPGSTFNRASVQPRAVLVATMAITTLRNSGQSSRNLSTMSPVSARATRHPTMVCAARTGSRGVRIVPPLLATRMPAIIGPRSSAAGKPVISSKAASGTELAIRMPHCAREESFAMGGCPRIGRIGWLRHDLASCRLQFNAPYRQRRKRHAGTVSPAGDA